MSCWRKGFEKFNTLQLGNVKYVKQTSLQSFFHWLKPLVH